MRTGTTNESQAGPQPREMLIVKPGNIQPQKLISWQEDQKSTKERGHLGNQRWKVDSRGELECHQNICKPDFGGTKPGKLRQGVILVGGQPA